MKILFFLILNLPTCFAHESHAQHETSRSEKLVISKEKSFSQLMDLSMIEMHQGMHNASMTGEPDHDFTTMMIPHHQGAVDMAKILLLYGKDEELRNLALQIISDQQNEINIMNAWLNKHPTQQKRNSK